MKRILICPGASTGVPFLSEAVPLSNVPLLGASLLEYWLSWLACNRATEALVLAHDRPEQVQALAGQGERWGLKVTVVAESRELTPAQALLKHASGMSPAPALEDAILLDRLPGMPDQLLFTSYQAWFAALQHWLPRAFTPDRVGMREIRSGVWVGRRARISPEAQLCPPCWIGQRAYVGAGAVLGPDIIVEDGAFIEPRAELSRSWVGPDTFVGQLARLTNSLAWQNTLVNWREDSLVKVPDPFLLCGLRRLGPPQDNRALARLAEVYSRNKADVQLLWKQLLLHKGS